MRKLIMFFVGFLLGFLLTIYPAYAGINYNNGPEPANPYYMHYSIDSNFLGSSGTGDFWVYIDDFDSLKYLKLDIIYSDDNKVVMINLYSGQKKLHIYKDGIRLSDASYFRIYYHAGFGSYTLPEHLVYLNSGYLSESYFTSSTHRTYEYVIHYNTIPIRNSFGETVVFPNASSPQYDNEEFFKITLPQNNFVQSGGLTQWRIQVSYQLKIDDSETFDISEWIIQPFSPTIKGLKVVKNDNWIQNLGMYKYQLGYMTADYYVPIGIGQTIYFKMINKRTGKTLQTQVCTYNNLDGFVDENNDGKDDRSGLTEDVGGVPPDWDLGYNGGNLDLEEWRIDTFFSNITKILSKFFQSISDLISSIGSMSSIFSIVTSVIPGEIISLLTASIVLFIILKIFGR